MQHVENDRWQVAGEDRVRRKRFRWSTLLWALVYPRRTQRVLPTVSGVILVALSFGIGTAAYNAANNILFITLSLLLACLVLSGVLSWLNFRGLEWRLELRPPLRAGQPAVVPLHLRNTKRILPSYGLSFEFVARMLSREAAARAETTLTARGVDVRAALAKAEAVEAKGRVTLGVRLDPGQSAQLDWTFTPARRGRLKVDLLNMASLFPFGFLRKQINADLGEEIVVWPAPIEYRRMGVTSRRRPTGGERVARLGGGSDLLGLRRYHAGDSHRAIHWKASARMRQLLVRQFAAETTEGFALWLQTDRARWTRPEQFELLLSLTATLAEDLFRAGKLLSVSIDHEAPTAVRRVRDVESYLDRLAMIEWRPPEEAAYLNANSSRAAEGVLDRSTDDRQIGGRRNMVTFAPDGPRGVCAFVDGEKLAAV